MSLIAAPPFLVLILVRLTQAYVDTALDFSLSPRRRSGERAGERGDSGTQRPSSPQPSPPSEGGGGVRPPRVGAVSSCARVISRALRVLLRLTLGCHHWRSIPRRGAAAALLAALVFAAVSPVCAADVGSDFDAANKLYEQGKYPAAAAAYEALLQAGAPADAVLFNLGNAWFKAGQTGRAIAAWRLAERSSPRDPSVRFNLQFARKRVTGSDAPPVPLWQRALGSLTLNEWTVLASALLWIWFLLLALREFKPALRKVLSGYTATTGLGALLLAGCLAAAATLQFNTRPAVVIVPEAIARTGPLDEAKVLHQLRDGTEVVVLDEKEVTVGDKKQTWLQLRDSARRIGWVKGDQVSVLAAKS